MANLNNEQKILSLCAKVPANTEGLLVSHFIKKQHKEIFYLIKSMYDAEEFVNYDTLKNRSREHADYIRFLIEQDIQQASFKDLCEYQKNFAFNSNISTTINSLSKLSNDNSIDVSDKQAQVQKHLDELYSNDDFSSDDLFDFNTGLSNFVDSISKEYRKACSGFEELNKLCPTLNSPGGPIIIAGRPGSGKTTLAQMKAKNDAINGNKVLFVSLEMSEKKIMSRFISDLSNIDQSKIHSMNFSNNDLEKMKKMDTEIRDKINNNIKFIDKPIKVEELKSVYRKAKKKMGGVDVIVIDYLQILQTFQKFSNTTDKVTYISNYLMNLSKELDVSIVLLSQLSRNCENRENKRPIPADLRDSGSIEQDAEVIIMVYRDEVYNENSIIKGYAEFIVEKNRNGKMGKIIAKSELEYSRFTDISLNEQNEVKKKINQILDKNKK